MNEENKLKDLEEIISNAGNRASKINFRNIFKMAA